MSYSLEEIKKDIVNEDVRQFYMKHIVRSENWYFEKILCIPTINLVKTVDDFKIIVSGSLGVSYNSVMMVGSGKTGYSLSPNKMLKEFAIKPTAENKSDIDIAIISTHIFDRFWKCFREGYTVANKRNYQYIARGIYRGYIDDSNINKVPICRRQWEKISNEATKKLKQSMYFKHDISYRIYRSWEDFEDYNLESLYKLKMEVSKNV